MQIKICYKASYGHAAGEKIPEVDKILAASEAFPYWTFWYPKDEEGKVRVRFLAMDEVREVELVGEDEEPKLASVTPINQEGR